MLKTKSKILLALFLVLALISSYCFATVEPRTSEPVTTSEGDISAISETESEAVTTSEEDTTASWTNGDLYICDDKVEVSNVVDGNAFIIGSEVTISGEIGGDLFVLADKLNIDGGYIYSNVFACANEITINGVVYDVYAACDTFNLETNGFIYRDMRVTTSDLNINGKVRRNAFVSAENMNFNAEAGTLIYGSLHYSSKSQIEIPEEAVTGEITYTPVSIDTNNNVANNILSYVLDLLQTLLFTFVITIILLLLTPKFVERVGKMGVGKSFASLGIGFVVPIALVVVAILLLISSVGASIFAVSIFAFILLALIGNTVASIFFGKLFTKVFKMEGNVKFVIFTLVSSLIFWAISIIPVIGPIFSLIVSIFGIGTTVVNMISRTEKVKEEKTEVKE